MNIAGSTEELLWNVSYQAVMATSLTRQFVVERHSNLRTTSATEFEETTTSNLLRHLGYYGQNLPVVAVQHTKTLEGGRTRKGRQVVVPSGADLELAIEVSPGKWLDLLLQAKTLKASGSYSSWSPDQNKKLVAWAAADNRIPGMLLYNDLVPPFVAAAPPTAGADYACAAFGACPSASRTQLGVWHSTTYCTGPDKTPAGISLCLDEASMLADPPMTSPTAIQPFHFQLEHLLHLWEHGGAVDGAGGSLDSLLAARPAWASELLEARDVEAQDESETDRDERPVEAAAQMSAVIPFVGRDG